MQEDLLGYMIHQVMRGTMLGDHVRRKGMQVYWKKHIAVSTRVNAKYREEGSRGVFSEVA